jgi:hypothetical protein
MDDNDGSIGHRRNCAGGDASALGEACQSESTGRDADKCDTTAKVGGEMFRQMSAVRMAKLSAVLSPGTIALK